MKTIMLLFWVLVGMSVFSQEPYRYLEVVIDHGDAWIKIHPKPITDRSWLEDDCIKTVSFRQFMAAEPTITQPEGFYLVEELEAFRKVAKNLGQPSLLNQVSAKSITTLDNYLSRELFGQGLYNLERDKFFLLWLSLTRVVVKSNSHNMYLDTKDKATQAALTGEWVWNLMVKSWTVQDVRVFVLNNPQGLAVNLLVDAGANIMTKIMVCPELSYKKQFSYDLVEKSSKDLKKFALCKK